VEAARTEKRSLRGSRPHAKVAGRRSPSVGLRSFGANEKHTLRGRLFHTRRELLGFDGSAVARGARCTD